MRRRNFRADSVTEDEGVLDLTPLLDVVFILLIFFIVTATFIKEAGVEIDRPEAKTADQKDHAAVLVAIDADNSIWIDQRRVDVRAVRANIARLHAENPAGGVVIQADELASVKIFTVVLDAAREVVAHDKIALATTASN